MAPGDEVVVKKRDQYGLLSAFDPARQWRLALVASDLFLTGQSQT